MYLLQHFVCSLVIHILNDVKRVTLAKSSGPTTSKEIRVGNRKSIFGNLTSHQKTFRAYQLYLHDKCQVCYEEKKLGRRS